MPELCDICLTIDQKICDQLAEARETVPKNLVQHFTDRFRSGHTFGDAESTIETGAREGCSLCRLLRWSLISFLFPEDKGKFGYLPPAGKKISVDVDNFRNFMLRPLITRYNKQRGAPIFRELHIEPKPEMNLNYSVLILKSNESKEDAASCPFAPNFDPKSQEVLDVARCWLAKCREQHQLCSAGSVDAAPKPMPARLLHIGASGTVRLVDIHDEAPNYMALSYCWGQTNFKGTTRDSLGRFIEGVQCSALPKTIHDAIQVASALGIKYCWVDALCIIQDSNDDWTTEAAKMASIYERAIFTLAAPSSRHSDEGLLGVREPSRYALEPCKLAGVKLHPSRPNLGDLHQRVWRKRAWTLQEELTSSRILYWDQNMLYWACRECQWYEWGHGEQEDRMITADDLDTRLRNWNHRVHLTTNPPSITGKSRFKNTEEFFWHWDRLHFDYWERKITYPKDWPVAIHGVASIFQNLRPTDQLVWGMWKDRFISELFWDFKPGILEDDHTALAVTPANANVPTWSWFSKLGQGDVSSSMYSDFESWESVEKAECLHLGGVGDTLFPDQAVARMRGWLMEDWRDFIHREDRDDTYWAELDGTYFLPLVRMHPSSDGQKKLSREDKYVREVRGLYLRSKEVAWHPDRIAWVLATRGGPADGAVLPMTSSQFAELESRPRQEVDIV